MRSCPSPSTTTGAAAAGRRRPRLERTAVADVFLDGKDLVLLGHDSNELARERTDRPAARLADAFTRHGYPWRTDGDPRAGDFRLWSDNAQGSARRAPGACSACGPGR